MKLRLILPGMALCAMLAAPSAQANIFGQLGPLGPTSTSGLEMFGAYLTIASHEIGATGQLRFGVGSDKVDAGVQGSYVKISDGGPSFIGAQVDLKAALGVIGSDKKCKWGGDAAVFFSHASHDNTFGIAAIPGVSLSSAQLSAWGGLGLLWEHNSYSIDIDDERTYSAPRRAGVIPLRLEKTAESISGSSSSAVMQLGAGYDFTGSMGLVGEWRHSFHEGGGDTFAVGVNFGMGKSK